MLWFVGLLGLLGVGVLIMLRNSLVARPDRDETDVTGEEGDTDLNVFDKLRHDDDAELGSVHSSETSNQEDGSELEMPDDEMAKQTLIDPMVLDVETPEDHSIAPVHELADCAELDANVQTETMLAIENLDCQSEDLVLVWNDNGDEPGTLQTSPNTFDPDITDIILDDILVGQVRCKEHLCPENISVVPLSAARHLGWVQT